MKKFKKLPTIEELKAKRFRKEQSQKMNESFDPGEHIVVDGKNIPIMVDMDFADDEEVLYVHLMVSKDNLKNLGLDYQYDMSFFSTEVDMTEDELMKLNSDKRVYGYVKDQENLKVDGNEFTKNELDNAIKDLSY